MSFASRSMYVSRSERIWQAAVADRGLAQTIEQETAAQLRTMKVLKQLAPSDYLLPIKRIAKYGRDQHERLTLPGFQKGTQLLATKLFDEYVLTQSEIKDSFFHEVNRFAEIYPDIIASAPNRLGTAFNPLDFPQPDKIKSYFDYEIRFAPVPETGNWVLEDVDTEELDKLRNEIDSHKNAMFREATKELYERTRSILQNLSDQASSYTEGKSNGAALRDATLNSVKDMAELVTSMNIVADPILDSVGAEMLERFAKLEAVELRTNADHRKEVADIAARLIEKLKGKTA